MSDPDSLMRTGKFRWPAIALFFALGVVLGWWTGDRPGPAADGPQAHRRPNLHAGDAVPGSDPVPGGPKDEAASLSAFEDLLTENLGSTEAEIARLIRRMGGDPGEIAETIIDSMSEEELVSSFTSFTDISPEKIEDAPDPHAYANRLVDLAMEDLITQPAPQTNQVEEVRFSEMSDSEEGGELDLTRFAGNERILARFPMKDYRGSEVFVKWTRLDDPEIMLFNHYPIKPDADSNYVWLEPKNGWEPGSYQVNFYSADDRLIPLATGRYSIDPSN